MARKKTPVFLTERGEFPKRLRLLMDERGTTQDELGRAIGVTRQAVGNYVSGQSSPSWESLVTIAKYFGVSADYLLGLSDTATTDTDKRAVCNYLRISEAAVNNMRRIAEMPKRADMRVPGIRALDLLLRAWNLDSLCMAISQNLLTVSNPLPAEFDTKDTFDALAKLEADLSNMYGGADFFIVCGSRAEEERKKNLAEAMEKVCRDALQPRPDVTQSFTPSKYDREFDSLYDDILAEIAEGEENAK